MRDHSIRCRHGKYGGTTGNRQYPGRRWRRNIEKGGRLLKLSHGRLAPWIADVAGHFPEVLRAGSLK